MMDNELFDALKGLYFSQGKYFVINEHTLIPQRCKDVFRKYVLSDVKEYLLSLGYRKYEFTDKFEEELEKRNNDGK